jgi:hypothetical protein
VSNVFRGLEQVSRRPWNKTRNAQLENILCIKQESHSFHPPCFVFAFCFQEPQRLLDIVLKKVRATWLNKARMRAHGFWVELQRWVGYLLRRHEVGWYNKALLGNVARESASTDGDVQGTGVDEEMATGFVRLIPEFGQNALFLLCAVGAACL